MPTRSSWLLVLLLAALSAPAAHADPGSTAPTGGGATVPADPADGGGASVGAAPPAPAQPAPKPKPKASVHLGQRTLRRGTHGHDVRVLQDFLTRAGFPTPVVGVFGPQTARNVKAFERSQGLAADGVVGTRVVLALRRAIGGHTALQPPPGGSVGIASLLADGTAVAPADAPPAIQAVIAAANKIASTPYLWGGGHATWEDRGYDCSGSVSYALHGGGLLDASEDSSGLMAYGQSGPGRWITIYSNPDHVYMVVAGLRYDTSGANPSRWQTAMRSGDGFTVRHPAGY
jgi:peptidoglycan hydrolase-like protein with peptidoglycan-binding domain